MGTSGVGGFLGGSLLVISLIALLIGILQIAAGVGSLGGKGWGRWTGIIISVILAILLILGGVSSLGVSNGMTSGVTTLVLGVIYALSAWALIQAGSFFAFRR